MTEIKGRSIKKKKIKKNILGGVGWLGWKPRNGIMNEAIIWLKQER